MKMLWLFLLLFLSTSALAQSGVYQSATTATPGQVPWWVQNGIVGGGVTANDSPVTTFGITNNSTSSFCISSQRSATINRQQFCFGVTDNGGATIALQNYGTDSANPVTISVNGVTAMVLTATGTLQFAQNGSGTASKYVCADSSNNIIIQSGAC